MTDSLPQHIFYKHHSTQQCDSAWPIAASSPPRSHLHPFNLCHRLFASFPSPLFHRLPTHNFPPFNTSSRQSFTRCPTSCTYHADFNWILYTRVWQLLASYIYHSSSHLRALLYNITIPSFRLTSGGCRRIFEVSPSGLPKAKVPQRWLEQSLEQYNTADATSIMKSIDRALLQLRYH